MADLAIGRNCPSDGTLCACSGFYYEQLLSARCPVCQQLVTVPNPMFVSVSVPQEIEAAAEALPVDEQEAILSDLEVPQEQAKLTVEQAIAATITPTEEVASA